MRFPAVWQQVSKSTQLNINLRLNLFQPMLLGILTMPVEIQVTPIDSSATTIGRRARVVVVVVMPGDNTTTITRMGPGAGTTGIITRMVATVEVTRGFQETTEVVAITKGSVDLLAPEWHTSMGAHNHSTRWTVVTRAANRASKAAKRNGRVEIGAAVGGTNSARVGLLVT